MFSLVRTNSNHEDFKKLTQLFDEFLIDVDGDEKDFFAQYNQIYLENVLICYENEVAIGCGAIKEYESNKGEIKRMFVLPEGRGKGIASTILTELETWAKELNYISAQLETSQKLKSAIAMYRKFGYEDTPNYGQYIGVESSMCMKKIL